MQHWSDPLLQRASPYLESSTRWMDAQLGGLMPWQIAILSAVTVLLLVWLLQLVLAAAADLKEAGEWCASAILCGASLFLDTTNFSVLLGA